LTKAGHSWQNIQHYTKGQLMAFYAAVNRLENRDRANHLNDIALATASVQPGADTRTLKRHIEALYNAQ
jgi:hypothetical protein